MPVPAENGGLTGMHGDACEFAVVVTRRFGDHSAGTSHALETANQKPGLRILGGEICLAIEGRTWRRDAWQHPALGDAKREVHDGNELERCPHGNKYSDSSPMSSHQGNREGECEQHPDLVVDLEDRVHTVDQGEAFTGCDRQHAEGRYRPTETIQAVPRKNRNRRKEGRCREGKGGGAGVKNEAGSDSDGRGRQHDPETTTEDHRCEDRERDQEQSKVAEDRPGGGEIRIGEEESPFAGAGTDSCHQLEDEGGGSKNTDRTRCTETDQTSHGAACCNHHPNSECAGQNKEVPRVGGYDRRSTDTAERGRDHPFSIVGFRAEPSPAKGREQHWEGDEMSVEISKEAGP